MELKGANNTALATVVKDHTQREVEGLTLDLPPEIRINATELRKGLTAFLNSTMNQTLRISRPKADDVYVISEEVYNRLVKMAKQIG